MRADDLNVRLPARLEVDPNRARDDRGLTVVSVRQASRPVVSGEPVIAVETEVEGPDYVAGALVERVDEEHGLIYVRVRWSDMRPEDERPHAAVNNALVNYVLSIDGSSPAAGNVATAARLRQEPELV